MKNKLVIAIAVIVILIGDFLLYTQPKAIVKNVDLLEIGSVYGTGEDLQQIDITNKFDLEVLKDVIAKYKCSRFSRAFAPYLQKDVAYEINGTYDGNPMHILAGNINIVYEDAGKGGYRIKESEKLLNEINLMIEP